MAPSPAGEPRRSPLACTIPSPRLWSTDTPHLYVLRVTLREGQTIRDVHETALRRARLPFRRSRGLFPEQSSVEAEGRQQPPGSRGRRRGHP
ncbi:hypothetical protein ACRAWD_00830 [Caulobacter segnis]